MQNLIFVTQEDFGELPCDFYRKDEEFYMTREQIGKALEYRYPRQAIEKIHTRHKERLAKFSTVVSLGTVEGNRIVERDVIVYSLKGIFEICRWSEQPKANAFMDWAWDIMQGLITGRYKLELIMRETQLDVRELHLDNVEELLDERVAELNEHIAEFNERQRRLFAKEEIYAKGYRLW